MRAVQPPDELRPLLERLFGLSRRSTAGLEAMLAAARRHDAGGVAKGLVRYTSARDAAHALAGAIGVSCETS
jgi:hypothetical protein